MNNKVKYGIEYPYSFIKLGYCFTNAQILPLSISTMPSMPIQTNLRVPKMAFGQSRPSLFKMMSDDITDYCRQLIIALVGLGIFAAASKFSLFAFVFGIGLAKNGLPNQFAYNLITVTGAWKIAYCNIPDRFMIKLFWVDPLKCLCECVQRIFISCGFFCSPLHYFEHK